MGPRRQLVRESQKKRGRLLPTPSSFPALSRNGGGSGSGGGGERNRHLFQNRSPLRLLARRPVQDSYLGARSRVLQAGGAHSSRWGAAGSRLPAPQPRRCGPAPLPAAPGAALISNGQFLQSVASPRVSLLPIPPSPPRVGVFFFSSPSSKKPIYQLLCPRSIIITSSEN